MSAKDRCQRRGIAFRRRVTVAGVYFVNEGWNKFT